MMKFIIYITTLLMSFSVSANLPYYPLQFPRDDAAHFENVPYPVDTLTEWWYYNGTLTSKTGRKLGYYASFNYVYNARLHLTLPWIQIQVTDIDNKKVYGKQLVLVRPSAYTISSAKLDIRNGKTFSLEEAESQGYVLNTRLNSEEGSTLSLSLRLTPKTPLNRLFIGGKGLIDMWKGTNSYYYSLPELVTEGYFQIGHEMFEIDANQSLSWMDHQWGDFLLDHESQWMWTSVQLQNGLALTLYEFVDDKTKKLLSGAVSVLLPDHSTVFINDLSRFSYTPHAIPQGEKYPHTYDLSIPELDLNLQLNALAPGQDVNGIWEGVSQAQGAYRGAAVTGQAYTENHVVY